MVAIQEGIDKVGLGPLAKRRLRNGMMEAHMKRVSSALIFLVLLIHAIPGHSAEPPVRRVTVSFSGPALSSGTSQEGIVLAVAWEEFTAVSFPRQNVVVPVAFWEGPEPHNATIVFPDAREKSFDPKYARYLLETSGFYNRYGSLALIASEELREGVYLVEKFLSGVDIRVDDPPLFVEGGDEALDVLREFSAGGRNIIWIRID